LLLSLFLLLFHCQLLGKRIHQPIVPEVIAGAVFPEEAADRFPCIKDAA